MMHDQLAQSALGKASAYKDQYDPSLLLPLPRAAKREEIGIVSGARLPFLGADLWTAYEVSWLNLRGKPQVAIAEFVVPSESSHIVESKSLKLYLNSFNNNRLADVQQVQTLLRQDITQAVWHGAKPQASVGVRLIAPEQFAQQRIDALPGLSLDRLDVECEHYTPAPSLLVAQHGEAAVSEVLVSQLLKSNCLVTGQPDWACIQISYTGAPIQQEGLLQYLVSFRNHNEFHEQCIERIYMDIWRRCQPFKLAVYARYTRRGGLDINPFRTSYPQAIPSNIRTARQ
jgi:7-cyano-7-deazaguanine reductase